MYAQIILPDRTPLALPWFDYIVPSELEKTIRPGQLILIPFRSRSHFGIVKSLTGKPTATKPLKPIEKIVITEPLLTEAQLKFLEETSELYHTSLGFLLKMNLLPLQKRKLSALSTPLEGGAPQGVAGGVRLLSGQSSLSKDASLPPAAYTPREPPSHGGFGKPLAYTYTTNQERSAYIVGVIHELPLQSGGQQLILVPEIVDVKKTQSFLPPELQEKTSVITSDLSVKELFEHWRQIWSGEKTIIVGTRRALFLPWHNLVNIIVDDEGNANHKSWDMAPRFHTRDAALILAKHQNAALHLLSHTPSVETFYFARQNVYTVVSSSVIPTEATTQERSGGISLDGVRDLSTRSTSSGQAPPRQVASLEMTIIEGSPQIINLKDEKRGGNFTSLSDDLVKAIEKTNGDIFLFLNRRGSLNYVACRDCRTVFRCPTCARPLSFHEDKKTLACHYCKYSEPMKPSCSKCGGVTLALYGAGTQQVEKEAKMIIDVAKFNIERVDSDAALTKRRDVACNVSTTTERRRIIIGTQLAWNHIDWHNISLMAFVDADISLFVPEYKATEDLWQLVRDAQFRLPANAKLFIQTSHPDHLVFMSLHNPEQFYVQELAQRKIFGYPPYNYLVRFYYGNADKRRAEAESAHLYRELSWLTKTSSTIKITPDLAMFPPYFRGKHWRVIVAKLSYRNYKKDLRLLLSKVPESWKVDPNPSTLLSF